MYFLINYSREEKKLVSIRDFVDGAAASKAKLEVEIASLGCFVRNEIVVLEAENLESLKASHSRYFKSFSDIQIEK
jgi:hypothetical protein